MRVIKWVSLGVVVAVALIAVALSAVSAEKAEASPQSVITVRFVQNGEPVQIQLSAPPSQVLADGVRCDIGVPAQIVTISEDSILWPEVGESLAEECKKGPPTTVTLEFHPRESDGSVLSADVYWMGEDVTVDLEVPQGIPVVTLEPEAQPLGGGPEVTSARLPVTGGAPGSSGNSWLAYAMGLLAAAIGVSAFAVWSAKRG